MNILVVCLGNICRSPLAQGILESKISAYGLDWQIDSAGTSSWHEGEAPDPRSIQTAARHGIDISQQRARQFTVEDFDKFELILAMDQSNYNDILRLARHQQDREKVKLILDYVYPGQNRAVPDPYYNDRFEEVFELLDSAAEEIITQFSEQPAI